MTRFLYQNLFKPIAFSLDVEFVHNRIINLGEFLENYPKLVSILAYRDKKLNKKLAGINFENPIGLAAGFDYDGHLAQVLKHVGFGFNTVGTVTAKPHPGNKPPRLGRLPESKALWVNKGFKSEGAEAIAKRLDSKNLIDHVVGISVGSINADIDDFLFSLNIFKNKTYASYLEINISCPNFELGEKFQNPNNFRDLIKSINLLHLKQPIFIKMPNGKEHDDLVKQALNLGISGFIFSNLLKDPKGNISGKPTFAPSNKLISHTRQKFGKDFVIIGCGGVFNAKDALEKIAAGADLIQLITGMIFEGPQLIGEICKDLAGKELYEV